MNRRCTGAEGPLKALTQQKLSSSSCVKIPPSLVCTIKVFCAPKLHMDIRILKIPWLASFLPGDRYARWPQPPQPVPGTVLGLVLSHSTLRTNEGTQHLAFVGPESILCFHNHLFMQHAQWVLLVPAEAPQPQDHKSITRAGCEQPRNLLRADAVGNNLRRVFLYLPCWQHPGQRGSTQCSEDNGPKLWTWRFFLWDSGQNSLLQQMKK